MKISLKKLWQRMIQLSEFFQYSFVLILKRKCLVRARRVRCGESGIPSTIIYTRRSSRHYELGCDAPVMLAFVFLTKTVLLQRLNIELNSQFYLFIIHYRVVSGPRRSRRRRVWLLKNIICASRWISILTSASARRSPSSPARSSATRLLGKPGDTLFQGWF